MITLSQVYSPSEYLIHVLPDGIENEYEYVL